MPGHHGGSKKLVIFGQTPLPMTPTPTPFKGPKRFRGIGVKDRT